MSQLTPCPPLQRGAKVATVACSSALLDDARLQAGQALLNSWGLTVLPSAVVGRHWGYLAGRDADRLRDLSAAAPLLACARGGWGAARLLEHPIEWQPGWLLGFSDVTALLWSRLAAGYDGNVHGPLLTTLASEPTWSQDRLRRLLFGEPLPDLEGEGLGGGEVSGPLIAANLTVATHLLNTRHVPDLKGAILVLEDVGEAPYRIDRMLTQWRLCGLFQKIAGIGFGTFEGCSDEADESDRAFTLSQVLNERTADLGIPRVMNLPFGHCPGNAALPLGKTARLDGNSGRLSLQP